MTTSPKVQIAFDLALAGAGNFFTINSTPIGGTAISGAQPLAGDVLVDVTADARAISVRRGRSRETDRFDAGVASVVLDNRDRLYDPSYKVTQSATGGDTTYEIDVSGTTYVVHEFTTVGTATFTPGIVPLRGVEYLVVAGGGGGGGNSVGTNGGGGAGGVLTNLGTPVSMTSAVTVVVGAGGLGGIGAGAGTFPTRGGNSQFGSVATAVGGGAGESRSASVNANGGCGGGGADGSFVTGGTGTAGQGFAGGNGPSGGALGGAGGGGGADAAGANGVTDGNGGNGGNGRSLAITGASLTYGGGGGGGARDAQGGNGGSGGGGTGGRYPSTGPVNATNGTNGLGGGGGGAGRRAGVGTTTGGNGGSGIVIVRYPKVAFPSPFTPSLIPRKAITIEVDNQRIFTGQVEDIDLQYDPDQNNTTLFKASDAFTLLNQVILTSGTATAQLTGARVNDILDDAAWPLARRDIDTGFASLGADIIGTNVNALQYLNTVAASEPGGIFVARDGAVAFRDRGAAQTLTGVVFADDGTGIPFSELLVEYGTERLFNSIEVVFTGGTATAVNSTSQLAYGINALSVTTLLQSGSDPQNLASYYSNLYGNPIVRFNKLTIPINGLSGVELGQVLSLDLGDAVEVKFTPNGIGDPIEQVVVIESIEHTITPQNHSMSLTLSGSQAGFILDTSQLDIDSLGF
jgi:hypothetical protein